PDADAVGQFGTFRMVSADNACSIGSMSPAVDDSVTPVNAVAPPGSTTYTLSEVKVLSDAAHRGNELEGRALVDYAIPGCPVIEYVAQGIFPLIGCGADADCLPESTGLFPDLRTFCNLDPALLDNVELVDLLGGEATGLCFFSE